MRPWLSKTRRVMHQQISQVLNHYNHNGNEQVFEVVVLKGRVINVEELRPTYSCPRLPGRLSLQSKFPPGVGSARQK